MEEARFKLDESSKFSYKFFSERERSTKDRDCIEEKELEKIKRKI